MAEENKECPDCGDRLFYTQDSMGQEGLFCLYCCEVKEWEDEEGEKRS